MKNGTKFDVIEAESPSKSLPAKWLWLGWLDYSSGKDYRPEYEKAHQFLAASYEQGRGIAALAAHYLGDRDALPIWPITMNVNQMVILVANQLPNDKFHSFCQDLYMESTLHETLVTNAKA